MDNSVSDDGRRALVERLSRRFTRTLWQIGALVVFGSLAVQWVDDQRSDWQGRSLSISGYRVATFDVLYIRVFLVVLLTAALLAAAKLTFLPAVRKIDDAWAQVEARQAELVLAEKVAVDASTAKSDFLANMSHELRTPMNGVIGMTSLLFETAVTEEQHEYLSAIRASGDSLLGVINDILDFSKIEARKLDIESYRFELRGQLDEVMDVLSPMAAEKGLALVLDVDPLLPDHFVADPARIRQILNNFLSNAVKFTESGEIVIRLSGEQLSTDRHADEHGDWKLHFSVSDTGIGVPKDRFDLLFQSFSQVDSSHSRRFGGTGLGLAISKQLAELMGGTAWAESAEGFGSTFHFTVFARCEPNDQALGFFASRQEEIAGKSVLVVEHQATALAHLERQLVVWGLDVVAVAGSKGANEALARGRRFDFIMIDTHLPLGDAIELAINCRAQCREAAIILMTPLGGQRPQNKSLRISSHLSKPIKPAGLFDALIKATAGEPLPGEPLAKAEQRPPHRAVIEKRNLRILIAEDNQVNQKVALGLLKTLGYSADVAGNGVEALDLLRKRPYDVVLMDVHMPEMDGCEATIQIRKEFAADRQPSIVAMTANAMAGDRERFLEIGMDDYVSKPVQPRRLAEALEGLGAAASKREGNGSESLDQSTVVASIVEAQPSHVLSATQVVPSDPALPTTLCRPAGARVDGDVLGELGLLVGDIDGSMRRDLIDTFLADGSDRLTRLISGAARNDIKTVKIEAHTLKSSSAQMGAVELSAICSLIEMAALAEGLESVQSLIDSLGQEFTMTSVELGKLRQELPTCAAA